MPLKGEAKRQHNKLYYQANKETFSNKHKLYYQENKEKQRVNYQMKKMFMEQVKLLEVI
jgi:hypothetical protein